MIKYLEGYYWKYLHLDKDQIINVVVHNSRWENFLPIRDGILGNALVMSSNVVTVLQRQYKNDNTIKNG